MAQACASWSPTEVPPHKAVRPVPQRGWPLLADDLPVNGLLDACDDALDYLDRVPAGRLFRFGREQRTAAELAAGMRRFREIVREVEDPVERTRLLEGEFLLLRSVGRDRRGKVLFTGYYEPLLEARREREPPFVHPVYGVPDDLVTVDPSVFGIDAGWKLVGRVEGRELRPYPERRQIDFEDGLRAPAEALGYLADPVDLFFLQVQGSGTLLFEDGSRLRAGYAVSNGRPYRSIGRLLIDDGLVERSRMSMQAIRAYLHDHPEDRVRVLSHNPSYVFFRPLEASDGPLGCYGVPVTPGRSIATDRGLFPAPVVAWIEGAIPDEHGSRRPFARFAVNLDTGGAIRGPGRVDLFIGAGPGAGEVAGRMQDEGRLYLLLPRAI